MRIALGLAYRGRGYLGWQSQPGGATVQDALEDAIERFVGSRLRVVCAGRTDAGVHALQQVVHFDAPVRRTTQSWVRGVNTFLPRDIAVRWAAEVPDGFHAQKGAISRRYRYLLVEDPVRPAVLDGLAGWTHRRLDGDAMRQAAALLLGTHDFSAFRASACQARSPVKTLHAIGIAPLSGQGAAGAASPASPAAPAASVASVASVASAGSSGLCVTEQARSWSFDFHANAFLHHMVRNIMGCLVAVGSGARRPEWVAEVLASRRREIAAPTFMPDGLYFAGPEYGAEFGLPGPAADLPVLLV